jgi:murein L,D-transpeptidase YcbB/YkuD
LNKDTDSSSKRLGGHHNADWIGRKDLRILDDDVDLPKQSFEAAAALNEALNTGALPSLLANSAPPSAAYFGLRQALSRYRAIAANGGWEELPPTTSVDIDATSASGAALLNRLAAEDGAIGPNGTSDDLTAALRRFQERHGLEPTGRIDAGTLAALNVPASERVLEIAANMERWRWQPRYFEPTYVTVNVPAGRLDIVGNDAVVLFSRVIVGCSQAPTPLLRAVATSIAVNPPWDVPDSIVGSEILPALRQNPDYLQRENMILVNGPMDDPYGLHIAWGNLTRSPYRIRQLPGATNALGQVKIEFPNRFNVFLHDTSTKAAFDANERYLSHGRVQVQQILPLASYALSGDPGTSLSQLRDAIAAGQTQHLSLDRPLPVYLLYWTVWRDGDGSVEFRPDIYGRDDRLIAVLAGATG